MANSRKSQFPDPIAVVESILVRTVSPGDRLVLGLSGGLDSVALLHILKRISPVANSSLSCLHVNHKISPNASVWARFCSDLCEKWHVPLKVVEVDISPHLSLGMEAAARIARYAAFEKVAAEHVVLAQHQDDQAETLLLQLFRGAGPKGLAAMGEATRIENRTVLRPLLGISRKTLEAYARENQLEWISDESNSDQRFDRNFVRHSLFPLIGERFPGFRETLARSSQHFAEAALLLDELAAIDAAGAIIGKTLKASRLQELSKERAKNLLRHYLAENDVRMPSARRLEEMLRQLSAARRDAAISIAHDGLEIKCYRGLICIVEPLSSCSGLCRVWHGESRVSVPELGGELLFEEGGDGLDPAKLVEPVTVRVREGGERFRPAQNRPEKSLKSLFQECGIPPWQRNRLPLLYCGQRLVWVPGIGLDPRYRAQKGWVPRWEPILS